MSQKNKGRKEENKEVFVEDGHVYRREKVLGGEIIYDITEKTHQNKTTPRFSVYGEIIGDALGEACQPQKTAETEPEPVITYERYNPETDTVEYGRLRIKRCESLKSLEERALRGKKDYVRAEPQQFSDAEVYINRRILARARQKTVPVKDEPERT